MIKKIVESLIILLAIFLHLLLPYKRKKKISKFWEKLYSHWISMDIGYVGKHVIIGRLRFFQGGKYISIGNNTCIGKESILTAWDEYKNEKFTPIITIGDNCSIGEFVHITACHNIIIGNGVLTGRYVYISDNSHGDNSMKQLEERPIERSLSVKGSVVIEDDVWIGDKVCILSGVHIGRGSVIAANAVVTHDVPAFSIVGGVPAKILKYNKCIHS